jgi:hypothetical protein
MIRVLMAVIALFALGNRAYCAEEPKAKLEDPLWAITGLEDNEATKQWILKQCKTTYPDNAWVQRDCVERFRRNYVNIGPSSKARD